MKKQVKTDSLMNNEQGIGIEYVNINELHSFKGHPFKVEQNVELFELMRSIEDKGVLVPLIVRTNPYGSGYCNYCYGRQ